MVRIAGERISDLFALAEAEARAGSRDLADRYVQLARRIGMRYNVRLLPEYSELYCRGCSRFWLEGTTVRTRLRHRQRVRTCLACGDRRRVPFGGSRRAGGRGIGPSRRVPVQPEVEAVEEAVEIPSRPSQATPPEGE